MWNKLFKKRQPKQQQQQQSDISHAGCEVVTKGKQTPASTTKCFSFRNGRKSVNGNDHYMLSKENFPFFQFESEIYKKPGENLSGYVETYDKRTVFVYRSTL